MGHAPPRRDDERELPRVVREILLTIYMVWPLVPFVALPYLLAKLGWLG